MLKGIITPIYNEEILSNTMKTIGAVPNSRNGHC